MLTRRLVLRVIRRLYTWSRSDPVDEELRGWNWDKPPLKPRAYLELGVSEISSKYCETRRDVWLRRVIGAKPEPTEPILKGKIIHDAITLALREMQRYATSNRDLWDIYEAVKNRWKMISTSSRELAMLAEKVYKQVLLSLLGEITYEEVVHGSRTPPLLVSEAKIDGSNLGLSTSLSADVLADGGVIIDFKYGAPRDFHKLSITGYALALESEYEIPLDYGIIVYFNGNTEKLKASIKPVYVNSHLRKWFIAERDEIIDMLLEKKEPPRDPCCSNTCPFRKVCAP